MTQKQQLIALFQRYGYKLTLGQIMGTTLAAEYRARMSELRNEGYVIKFSRGQTPSLNEYRLVFYESNGQGRLL